MRIDTERFEVEHVVGSGAMGTVFRARDKLTGESVALKVMRIDSAGGVARFHREAGVLAHLTHPNIVRYVGHGITAHGERFLVMEWLEGETLRARLVREGLPLASAVILATHVAEALAEAHRAGVIHRDIKPTNLILVGGDVEAVKVVDFGVAHWSRTAERVALTATGDVVGTPAYMAPEQAGGVRRVTPAADVFGLGCVLYECVAGRSPFVVSRLAGHSSPASLATPPHVRSLRPEVPAAVADLIERMLARAPAARPPDGDAALALLRALDARALALIAAPTRPRSAPADERTATPLAPSSEPSAASFAELQRDHGSAPSLSETSAQILTVLARHVPMPMAVLRSQCERLHKDPLALEHDDLEELAPALADAAARFASPGRRALVISELRALAMAV